MAEAAFDLTSGAANQAAAFADPAASGTDRLIDLYLIDAEQDTVLTQVAQDGELDAAHLATGDRNLQARLNSGEIAESFVFKLDGEAVHMENAAPYALFGDLSGDFHAGTLPNDTSTLTVLAYSEDNGGGELLAEEQFMLITL